MSTLSKENRVYLKRAWRHLLGSGLWKNKKSALIIFLMGLLTTLIQIFAVLLLVGAARAYDADGILSVGAHTHDISSGAAQLIYTCLTGTTIVISVLAGLVHKLIVTRIGRQFYQNLLNDTRLRLVSAVKNNRNFERSSYLQYLSRDCRYLSLSYMRVMNLIQPALLLVSVFIISLITVPIAAAFLGIAGLLVLPLNIYLVLWAARTSQDIQSSAKLKSKEEADFIARISSDPFIADTKTQDLIESNQPGEQGFLGAFVKRQRMSAYSQSITDIMMALVIIALATLLFLGGGTTLLLKLSSLVILVILFRFIVGYISNLSQAIMMVSSYEPFFRPLLDLWAGEDSPNNTETFKGELDTPIRAAIFQPKKSDWSDANTISAVFKLGGPLQILTADFTPNTVKIGEIMEMSKDYISALNKDIQDEISAFQAGNLSELSDKAKLFLTLAYGNTRSNSGYLIDGALLRDLDRLDLRAIFSAADDRPIIVVYRAVPRRLVLPPRFQLLSRSPTSFNLICHAHEFVKKREMIVDMMQKIPTGPETEITDSNVDIII